MKKELFCVTFSKYFRVEDLTNQQQSFIFVAMKRLFSYTQSSFPKNRKPTKLMGWGLSAYPRKNQ